MSSLTLMDERQATNKAAKQVLSILDTGEYLAASGSLVSVRDAQDAAERGTWLYTPEALAELRENRLGAHEAGTGRTHTKVEVIDATTQVAAQRFAADGAVVLLNFASARNPGGGFLGGAKAQEEELCRCSGLYRTLITQPDYYTIHREERSLLYSDHIIYSPEVPFFRVSAKAPWLEAPFLASVITAPAPNAGAIRRNQPRAEKELAATFSRRWQNILAVARDNQQRTLILGAWGCGAFRNDPKLVARCAFEAIDSETFAGAFERVVFAIPSFNVHSQHNLDAFREVFGQD